MKNWTTAQKQAIDAKGSTLVTASAGTGKTAVLTEKVTSVMINEGVTVEELLVMTFSNAAAEEMKTRISNKLIEIIKDKNIPFRKRHPLYNQIKLLHTSHIQTIHSFCYDVVKKFYYEAGLDSNLKIGDSLEVAVLQRKAIKTVLESEYKNKDNVFIELLEYFDNSETVEDIFINAYEKIYNNINPEEWMAEAVEKYNVSEDEIPALIKDKLVSDFEKALALLNDAAFAADIADDEKLSKAIGVLETDIACVDSLLKLIKRDDISAFSGNILDDFGATIRFPSAYSDIKDTRNKAKDIVDKYKKTGFDIKEQTRRIKHMYPIVKKFCDIILEFDKEYSALKRLSSMIDFHDMERYANKILSNPSVSSIYRNTFKYVFVDEYQDTSPIQEAIISKICRQNNLFCVGDQKQSIYRFRASEPILFINRDNAYRNNEQKGQVIALNSNFRSNKNILDCANDVFYNITSASSEINYQQDDALVHGREDDGSISPVEVHLIDEKMKEDYPELNSDELEVLNIVKIINTKLKEQIFDTETGTYRNVRYGDIVVLCRKLTGLSEYITKIFGDNNIPYIIEKSGGLFSTVEIQNLLNILSLAEDMDNDIALISFIHEGFMGFNDDDLLRIRKVDYTKPLIDNIREISEDDSSTGIKARKFLEFMNALKTQERYLMLTDIVSFVLSSLNYIDYYAIQQNGKQRVANIKQFEQYVYNYEQNHAEKIRGFLDYIKEVKDANVIIDEAKVNYSDDSVHVTTIHKSKGLEYPIVIIPFMNKAFSSIDKRANVSIERTVGIGFRYFNLEAQEKGRTLIRDIVNDVISDKNKEEEMRLLYVAMTRAKENLIIQGTLNGTITGNPREAKSMMDWITSTIFAGVEDKDEVSVSLNGKWKLFAPTSDDLREYYDSEMKVVDKDTFLARYSLPPIKTEEITPSFNVDKNIPTAIPASKIFAVPSPDNMFKRPRNKKKYNASDVGSATHAFLKNLDFNADTSYFGLMEQRDEMVANGIIKQDIANMIDIANIDEFLTNDNLAKMIKSAEEIKREISISYIADSEQLNLFSGGTKKVLVRCVIDLLFKKDGKWYLVDYKTDRIEDPNDDNELTDKINGHKGQLSFYEMALIENMGIKVEDSYIVFLNIPKSFRIFDYE